MRRRRTRRSGFLVLVMGLGAASAGWGAENTPLETVNQYIQAVYSRNYAEAYALISEADKQHKSPEAYLRENVSFEGPALELAAALASHITVENPRTELHGDRATVTLDLTLPDGNDPHLRELFHDFQASELRALSDAGRQQIAQTLTALAERKGLPVIRGEERFELIKEADGWKLFLNWSGTVRVRFVGEVKMGLPWEFTPVQDEVRAPPGEILRAAFRVRNLSEERTTGKARHVILPADANLDIIQCFCFIEQTLDPGEEREMPLFFRVRGDSPADLQSIEARYEFYPVEQFNPEWEKHTAR